MVRLMLHCWLRRNDTNDFADERGGHGGIFFPYIAQQLEIIKSANNNNCYHIYNTGYGKSHYCLTFERVCQLAKFESIPFQY